MIDYTKLSKDQLILEILMWENLAISMAMTTSREILAEFICGMDETILDMLDLLQSNGIDYDPSGGRG